jgi:hypothetical protein
MTVSRHEQSWEGRLRAGLGESPQPDFDDWLARHAKVIAVADPSHLPRSRAYRRIVVTSFKLIAASLLPALALFWLRSSESLGRNAFAQTIAAIDAPKTLTWTTTYYGRVTSTDNKRTWIRPERRLHAYLHPGHYRETMLDEAGQPRWVQITDVRAGRMLELDLKVRKAVLKTPFGQPDIRGPFAWVGEALRERMVAKTLRVKSVSLQGQREVDKMHANVVRAMIDRGDDLGYARHDFCFDKDSKRLVAIWIPAQNDYDLETAPDRNQPAEKKFSTWLPFGYWEHEIVLDPKLEVSDFSLDPPAGFAFEAIAKPTITEEEMVAFLGAAARFNDGIFPDSPYAAFDQAKFNAAAIKPAIAQSPAERELIGLHDKFLTREVYRSPVRQFVEDHTEPGSFQYVGAGAKLGDAGRILCWYKTRGAAKTRAVFGDLSVRDVSPSELPLDLPR